MKEVIEKLRNDEDYYGEFGQQYLSNSVIKTLLENPKAFGQPQEQTAAMIQGRYLHAKILEPHTLEDTLIIDSSTRNTKIYKEAVEKNGGEMLLLQKEVDNLDLCAEAITSNMELYDLIRAAGIQYEEPGVKELFGNTWKAKRDAGGCGMTIDIKTTSDILKFKRSAWTYNYDSQAWIYEQIFGEPMFFIVVDKNTHQVGLFGCSDEFLERGKEKVLRATQVYNDFFGPDKTKDIDEYIIRELL